MVDTESHDTGLGGCVSECRICRIDELEAEVERLRKSMRTLWNNTKVEIPVEVEKMWQEEHPWLMEGE